MERACWTDFPNPSSKAGLPFPQLWRFWARARHQQQPHITDERPHLRELDPRRRLGVRGGTPLLTVPDNTLKQDVSSKTSGYWLWTTILSHVGSTTRILNRIGVDRRSTSHPGRPSPRPIGPPATHLLQHRACGLESTGHGRRGNGPLHPPHHRARTLVIITSTYDWTEIEAPGRVRARVNFFISKPYSIRH